MKINFRERRTLRGSLLVFGVALIGLSLILFISSFFGMVAMDTFSLFGQSGLRTLAGIAVAGCMLAAIGSWDE